MRNYQSPGKPAAEFAAEFVQGSKQGSTHRRIPAVQIKMTLIRRENKLANSPVVEQITFAPNGTTMLTTNKGYDALNGLTNIVSEPIGSSAVGYRYAYNAANQRTAVTNTDSSRWVYSYDALGQVTGGKKYWNDGTSVAGEHFEYAFATIGNRQSIKAGGDNSGAGGIGGMLARSHGYSSGNWTAHNSYHADGNGNITYLVNSSQTLAASYRYDPYGNTIGQGGTLGSVNKYRFSSKELMAGGASGIYYYGYRFYDPNLQRWLNRDPIGEIGGINLYTFVRNGANLYVDPFGHGIFGDAWETVKKWCGIKPKPKKPQRPPEPPFPCVLEQQPDGTYTTNCPPPKPPSTNQPPPPPKKHPCAESKDWESCFGCMTDHGATAAQAADYCNRQHPG